MSIVVSDQYIVLKPRLLSRIKAFINRGSLRIPQAEGSSLLIGFALDIQMVRLNQSGSIVLGKPEGIQVLLLSGRTVVAVLDFFQTAGRLKFSHGMTGESLTEFVSALNALEERYRSDKRNCRISGLHFLIRDGLFFSVRSGRSSAFFQYSKGLLKELTRQDVLRHFQEIIKTRAPLTPTR